MPLKIDLHCHTNASDGSLGLVELLQRAAKQGVDILAITDHDTTAVYPEAIAIARDNAIQLIPAVEISAVGDRHQEVHIVGLGVDINNQSLQKLLEDNRSARKIRAGKIVTKLQKAGCSDLEEQLDELVQGDVICRSHLAQVILNAGLVKNFQGAFDKFLAKKKRAWVPIQWQEMSLVVDTIRSAGGQGL